MPRTGTGPALLVGIDTESDNQWDAAARATPTFANLYALPTLHALFRQNYGCAYLIVGRDHAGVGSYYGPFDSHKIFDEIPREALAIRPMKIDWTFWCYRCVGMASARTCPHGDEDRLLVSGTKLRKWLSEGSPVPAGFGRQCSRSCARITRHSKRTKGSK